MAEALARSSSAEPNRAGAPAPVGGISPSGSACLAMSLERAPGLGAKFLAVLCALIALGCWIWSLMLWDRVVEFERRLRAQEDATIACHAAQDAREREIAEAYAREREVPEDNR